MMIECVGADVSPASSPSFWEQGELRSGVLQVMVASASTIYRIKAA